MKIVFKRVVSIVLIITMSISMNIFVSENNNEVKGESVKINEFGVEEGTAIEDQDMYDSLMDLIDHLDSPEDFACWTAKAIIAAGLKCDTDPNYRSVDEKLDTIISNQEAILNAIQQLDEKIVKSEIISELSGFLKDDWNGEFSSKYNTIRGLDKQINDASTQDEIDKIEKLRKQKIMFSLIGQEVDTNIIDGIDNSFDLNIYLFGSYLTRTYDVLYGSGNDYLYGMYNQLLKYNYKWEHQAYDIKSSFQNACLGKYLTMVTLDRLSLSGRIEAYENGYTDSQGNEHPAHGEGTAALMRQRLIDLNNQVITLKGIYKAALVKKRDNSVRYYQYPGHEQLIYADAKHATIPNEYASQGTDDIWAYMAGKAGKPKLKGLHGEDKGNYFDYVPTESFWNQLVQYDDSKGTLSVSYDWLKQVYNDYGGKKSLKEIFGSDKEGNLDLPSGMDDSWQFVVDPDSSQPVKYWYGGLFRADRIYSPVCDSKGDVFEQIMYYYHYKSNEKPKADYTNKFVSIGVVPEQEDDDLNKVSGDTARTRKSICLAKAASAGKNKNKITIKYTFGADKYKVYACKCKGNKKGSFKKLKTIKYFAKNTKTIKHKKIDKGSVYKYKVVAYNGKKKVATSKVAYAIPGKYKSKYSNVKSVTLKTKKVTLNVGKTKKIKASLKTFKNKKRLKSAKKFRYTSSNKKIVTVDKNGKIKAISSGEAFVYVQSVNGIWKTVKVTVS